MTHLTHSEYGTNSGHGHVWERPDGLKAKCGGPAICAECSRAANRIQGTHPTEPNIRERLARAAFAEFPLSKTFAGKTFADDLETEQSYRIVDAILAELENPSEGMLAVGRNAFKVNGIAVRLTDAALQNGLRALIQHIRDGGK